MNEAFPPTPPGIKSSNGDGGPVTFRELMEKQRQKNGHDIIPWKCPFPIDPTKIPRRPWLVKGLLLRRHVTMLVAPPGSGKSLMTLQIGLFCGANRIWAGWKPKKACRVLVINSEEDNDEQERRLWAAAKVMNIPQDELGGIAVAVNPETIVIGKTDARTKTIIREPMFDKIKQTIIDGEFDLVIVDPFAETFIGEENNNSEVKWAVGLWREVARSTNTAVVLVHHSVKYAAQMAGDMDAARGGGSVVGVARIVATLFGITEEDSKRFDLESESVDRKISIEEMRSRLLRFDDAKANYSLLSPLARCFYKETLQLDNGGDGEDGDEVGVLTEFKPQTRTARLLQSCDQANFILDKIQAGVTDDEGRPNGQPFQATPKRGPKPKHWAGNVIQEVIQCSAEEASEVLDIWVRNKVLEKVQVNLKERKSGGLAECLRVVEANRPGAAL